MNLRGWLACLLAMSLLSGCVPLAVRPGEPVEAGPLPVRMDAATVYVYRDEIFGAILPIVVAVNGVDIGATGAYTFFELDLKPGAYRLESFAGGVSVLDLQVEAGKNYFVWQEIKLGQSRAASLLQAVDESTGSKGVRASRRILASVDPQSIPPRGAGDPPVPTDYAPSKPPAGKALLYVLREASALGSAQQFLIEANGRSLSMAPNGNYRAYVIPPGPIRLVAGVARGRGTALQLDARAGETVFVRVNVGFLGPDPALMPEREARELLRQVSPLGPPVHIDAWRRAKSPL